MTTELMDVFREARLNVRQWPMWKLKCRGFGGRQSWDHMTAEDQMYSLAFNDLLKLTREMNPAQVLRVVKAAKRIVK